MQDDKITFEEIEDWPSMADQQQNIIPSTPFKPEIRG
jgi:hypothetical protein